MEILLPKSWTKQQIIETWRDPGRKRGQTAGTYVDDLCELAKTIILCPLCTHAMNWRRKGYYNVSHYEHIHCQGRCDGCRNPTNRGTFLIHETNVDACWMRKDEGRKFRPLGQRRHTSR